MEVIYYGENPPYKYHKSIFLGGPALRVGQEGISWRKEALRILDDMGYDGVVFCPENREGYLDEKMAHSQEFRWDQQCLSVADVIVIWLPRKMDTLPGLETNIEFGEYMHSKRLVFGYPEDAEKVRSLHARALKLDIPVAHTLTHTLRNALDMLEEGAERVNAERRVPLLIWKSPAFQAWYRTLINNGNRLEECQTLHTIGSTEEVGISIIRPNIFLPKENRFKSNEVVISRNDIVCVCMWQELEDDQDMEIVLVREVRSPVRNAAGYVYELPGGAVENEENLEEAAIREIGEEVGVDLDEDRLKLVGSRQVYSTLLSHKAHLFSYQMDDKEVEWVKSRHDIAMGVKSEGEKTFAEVVKLSAIKNGSVVDWSVLGQISVAAGRV